MVGEAKLRGIDLIEVNEQDHIARVRLDDILDQIKDWTLAPGHQQEIIMFSLGSRKP